MLINEREYNKFLENISIYKFILIHGQDRGKVNEKCLEIVNKFNRLNQDSLETIGMYTSRSEELEYFQTNCSFDWFDCFSRTQFDRNERSVVLVEVSQ